MITEDLQLAKKVVIGDKIEIDASEEQLPNDIRLKLLKNIGHISSLLFQDPDTLITNNEYKVFNTEDDEDEMVDDNYDIVDSSKFNVGNDVNIFGEKIEIKNVTIENNQNNNNNQNNQKKVKDELDDILGDLLGDNTTSGGNTVDDIFGNIGQPITNTKNNQSFTKVVTNFTVVPLRTCVTKDQKSTKNQLNNLEISYSFRNINDSPSLVFEINNSSGINFATNKIIAMINKNPYRIGIDSNISKVNNIGNNQIQEIVYKLQFNEKNYSNIKFECPIKLQTAIRLDVDDY